MARWFSSDAPLRRVSPLPNSYSHADHRRQVRAAHASLWPSACHCMCSARLGFTRGPHQKIPRTSLPRPWKSPQPSLTPWAPLRPMAVVTLGTRYLPRVSFSLFSKCLHKVQPSGTRQRVGLCPAPPSPALHLALGAPVAPAPCLGPRAPQAGQLQR